MRIAIGIEYDGTGYNGWQRQTSGVGIQQRLEEALSRVADPPIEATPSLADTRRMGVSLKRTKNSR